MAGSVAWGGEPFREALEFFQRKKLVSTQHWHDLLREGHDAGFTVAGVAKVELLQAVRNEVHKAIQAGTAFSEFQRTFEAVIAKHGWTPKQGAAWRARVIFDTNLRTANQAGRWRQMTQPTMLKARPYWIYRHGESIVPRPMHLSWNGLTLPASDPWFRTHYPPNGWGCHCRVFAVTRREVEARGGPDQAPPIEWQTWTDRKTGVEIRHPKGIDPGWDYAPGASLAERARQVAETKLPGLDPDLRQAVERTLKPAIPDELDALRKHAKRRVTMQQAMHGVYEPVLDGLRQDLGDDLGGLSPDQAVAVKAYTSDGSSAINQALRGVRDHAELDPVAAERVVAHAEAMDAALDALPEVADTVYRGVDPDGLPDDFLPAHTSGAVVRYAGYTSTSLGELKHKGKPIILIIRARHGRLIERWSGLEFEREVLLPRGSHFRVTDVVDEDGTVTIAMDEIDPPPSMTGVAQLTSEVWHGTAVG